MEKPLLYQVKTTWKEGRVGIINSTVLDHEIEVATPPEFEKGVTGMWSPEHLLIAAVSSCFMTTFLALAEKTKLKFKCFNCSATLILERKEGKLHDAQIAIHPILTICNSSHSGKGLKILTTTEKLCVISNMLKTEIMLLPQIIIEQEMSE